MLESSIIYILVRTIPESIILMLSGMILLGIKIEKNTLIKNGLILGSIIWSIRILPINFGVHTVLSMIVFGVINLKISNRDLYKSIITTLVVWVALVISEGIYVGIIVGILKVPFQILMDKTSIQGALITLPSLLIILVLVYIYMYIERSIKKNKKRGWGC